MPKKELIARWLASYPCSPSGFFGSAAGGLEHSGLPRPDAYPCQHQFSREPAHPPNRRRRRDLPVRLRPRRASIREFLLVDGIAHFLSGTAGGHLRRLGEAFDLAWCTGGRRRPTTTFRGRSGWTARSHTWCSNPTAGPPTRTGSSAASTGMSIRPGPWLDRRCPRRRVPRPGPPPAPAPTLLVTTDPRSGSPSARSSGAGWAGGLEALAVTENTGGRRVAAVNQLAPASPEPNTSPEVAPK